MRDFLRKIGRHDKVLLIGDVRQHQGVDAGKPFEQLQESGMQSAILASEPRQKGFYRDRPDQHTPPIRGREKRLRCAPANSPCKPSSGSSKTGRNTRFHGPLAVKPGHTSMAPRRKGVGNSARGCHQRTAFLLGFRHPGRCVPVPYL
jgi:hypothetical protein